MNEYFISFENSCDILLKHSILYNGKKSQRVLVEPRQYARDQHIIRNEQVDHHALYILEKLRAKGHVAYLVGGGVRDLLLGKKPKDFDISTSAKPEEIRDLFRNCILIGRRFRLAHIRFGKKIIEVSTFRSGDTEDESLIVRDNDWGSPEEDVKRRDFTINGLFYDAHTETVIDYVGGYEDIEKQLLRAIGKPFTRFKQDPVRMIRLIKFQARFGFNADPEALEALMDCRHEILKSSQARIFEEILRMLESGFATNFFRLMSDKGFLHVLLPELGNFLEGENGEEVYTYLSEIDTIHKEPGEEPLDRCVLLCALMFPFFEKALQIQYLDHGKIPHLGEVQNLTYEVITAIFSPFFKLPRRIKGKMIEIIASQYRIIPFERKKIGKIRIPKTPDFPDALLFAQLRARIEPGYMEIVRAWMEACLQRGKERRGR